VRAGGLPHGGRAAGPPVSGMGAGRDRTSAQDAAEWEHRRDIDTDPWYAPTPGPRSRSLRASRPRPRRRPPHRAAQSVEPRGDLGGAPAQGRVRAPPTSWPPSWPRWVPGSGWRSWTPPPAPCWAPSATPTAPTRRCGTSSPSATSAAGCSAASSAPSTGTSTTPSPPTRPDRPHQPRRALPPPPPGQTTPPLALPPAPRRRPHLDLPHRRHPDHLPPNPTTPHHPTHPRRSQSPREQQAHRAGRPALLKDERGRPACART
jgi:hypothetical protein